MSGPRDNPFKSIGGVTPCPGGWLVLPGRLAGVTVIAEEAFVLRTFAEVLDYRPKFDFAAVNIPFGYPEHPGRAVSPMRPTRHASSSAGRAASTSIRFRRRAALFAKSRQEALALEPWLTKNDFRHFKWMKEAAIEIQPFHSRSIYSGNAVAVVHAHERRSSR